MAEVEIVVTEEVKRLKNEIKALQKKLDKPNASKEELPTLNMLGRHRHIIQQQAWPWQWEHVDALYTLMDCIPTWVVNDKTCLGAREAGLPRQFQKLGSSGEGTWYGADAIKGPLLSRSGDRPGGQKSILCHRGVCTSEAGSYFRSRRGQSV